MNTSDFTYDLPEELIAQEPAATRDGSRMLVLDDDGHIQHRIFRDFSDLLRGDELLVFNDSRVIPARMWARKPSGGRVELLVLRILPDGTALSMTRSSKPLTIGLELTLDQTGEALQVIAIPEPGRAQLRCPGPGAFLELLHREGAPPLPPYIRRAPHWKDETDRSRYQTVYAANDGSVAAPTAGLHFTDEILARLRSRGVPSARITLHVGPGTFQPVRCQRVEDHVMQTEHFVVSQEAADLINRGIQEGRRILAVGTTTVRCLETAGASGKILPGESSSNIFIYPGYKFRIVHGLLTNFHLPGSTLIMLVSALAGRERVLAAYESAVAQRYRFYSYGDCMLIR